MNAMHVCSALPLRRLALAACALSAFACGDDVVPSEQGDGGGGGGGAGGVAPLGFVSGTRLRAMLLDGGDGAISFRGFFDTELQADCYAHEDRGEVACIPGYGYVQYADSDCEEPVIVGHACSEPPRFAAAFADDAYGCGIPEQVYERGALATAVTLVYERDDATGECLEGAPPYGDVYELQPFDPSAFARGTVATEPLDQALERVMFRFDDGAAVAYDAADLTRSGTKCGAFALTADGARCVPYSLAYTEPVPRFGDASCTHEVAQRPDGCFVPGTANVIQHFSHADAQGCSFEVSYSEAGPSVLDAFSLEDGVCTAVAPSDDAYFEVGASIDEASLPALEKVKAGTGRLRTTAPGVAGTRIDPYATFEDTAVGRPCDPIELGDGALRCVPVANYAGGYFADAACAQPLARASACGQDTAIVRVVRRDVAGCDVGPDELREVGPAHEGPVYELQGESCVEVTDPPLLLTLLDVIPPETFPTIEARIE